MLVGNILCEIIEKLLQVRYSHNPAKKKNGRKNETFFKDGKYFIFTTQTCLRRRPTIALALHIPSIEHNKHYR